MNNTVIKRENSNGKRLQSTLAKFSHKMKLLSLLSSKGVLAEKPMRVIKVTTIIEEIEVFK